MTTVLPSTSMRIEDPDQSRVAMLNILEDASAERDRLGVMQEAILNLLEDAQDEKGAIENNQRALINILADMAEERVRTLATHDAILNILEDAQEERAFTGQAETALVNILDDLDAEKARVESVNRDLARSNGDLEQYAYVISHDLSEPLRAISGPIALLVRRYGNSFGSDARELFGFAQDGCERMQKMIEGLLLYSRVGRIEEDAIALDLTLLAERLVATMAPIIEAKGAEIRISALPTITGVAAQLGHVLQNLISNAIKFVPAGTRPLVEVGAARVGEVWRFEVVDNGIGVEERHRDRVWGMFKRLHTREEFPGTGIGLAVVKRIVERHGGSVGVKSRPSGSGSVFWFTLPAAPTEEGS